MTAKKTIKKTNKPAAKREARSKSRPNRRIAASRSTVPGGDTPNEAWLTIHVDSVEVNEGSAYMGFTASLWGNSVGFGTGTGQERRRILYDGPYQPPPYSISVSATERDPNSDDEFTEGTIALAIDLGTLEGSASTTISQVPGDKDDNDTGDDANDPDDPDETASYLVTCSGQITPAVEMSADNPIDWDRRTVTFDVLPPGVPGSVNIILHASGIDIPLVSGEMIAGGNNLQKQFDFEAFPPDKDISFNSVEVEFTVGNNNAATPRRAARAESSKSAKDKRAVKGLGKGKCQITAYFLPEESLWTGETEQVAFNEEGEPPYVSVHKDWVRRVRGSEARGQLGGKVYGINLLDKEDQKDAPDGTKVIHWLQELPEGGCGDRTHKALARLTENMSLARGINNAKRFPCWSQWRLSTDPGVVFQIQDAGNFITENRLDRYAGPTGPDPRANVGFKAAYVYRV
jgi:hypothetical protein